MIKKGINSGCFPENWRLKDIFKISKSLGYEGVELNMKEDPNVEFHIDASVNQLQQIADIAREEGLELPSVSTTLHWKYSLTHSDKSLREKGTEIVSKMLRAASIFGSKTILVVPGVVTEEVSYDEAYQRSFATIKELGNIAKEFKVRIGIENVWNKFLLSPLEMKQFIRDINSEWVGCYFDVGNILYIGYPEQWIEILAEDILAVHLKDFKSSVGNINGFVPLLSGDINWSKVHEALKKINYNGYITPELKPHHAYPEQVLGKTSHDIDAIFSLDKKEY